MKQEINSETVLTFDSGKTVKLDGAPPFTEKDRVILRDYEVLSVRDILELAIYFSKNQR